MYTPIRFIRSHSRFQKHPTHLHTPTLENHHAYRHRKKKLPVKAIAFDIGGSLEHFPKIEEGKEFIRACKAQGILLCAASGGDYGYIRQHLSHFDDDAFCFSIKSYKGHESNAFSQIMRALNKSAIITAAEVLVVGDDLKADIAWAALNGAQSFHIKKDEIYSATHKDINTRYNNNDINYNAADQEWDVNRDNLFRRHVLNLKALLNIK